jgi:RNA polymerase sigma-70 factor (ECF subfamily)
VASLDANTDSYAVRVNIAAKVFGEYGDFIHAVIRYKVGNEAQADDLFQDFFLSIVSKPPPPSLQNIKGYLYRAITNDIVDAMRRMKRYESHVRKYGEQLHYSINKNGLENTLIEGEELDKLFAIVKQGLPESESQAIALRYRDSRSIEEAAEKMGVNNRTISRYISVGLKKIRRFLPVKRSV